MAEASAVLGRLNGSCRSVSGRDGWRGKAGEGVEEGRDGGVVGACATAGLNRADADDDDGHHATLAVIMAILVVVVVIVMVVVVVVIVVVVAGGGRAAWGSGGSGGSEAKHAEEVEGRRRMARAVASSAIVCTAQG